MDIDYEYLELDCEVIELQDLACPDDDMLTSEVQAIYRQWFVDWCNRGGGVDPVLG